MGPKIRGMNLNSFNFVVNPLDELANAQYAFIEQQVSLTEVLTGCETQNRFHVVITTYSGQNIYLFKCKEMSDWCDRNCLSPDMRPFQMYVKHIQNMSDYSMVTDFMNPFVIFNRPYKCTCCCLARPEMHGSIPSQNNLNIGRVMEPCTLCDPYFFIYDQNDVLKWTVTASCCQCGYMCRNGCGRMCDVNFPIFPATATAYNFNDRSGLIRKVFATKELYSQADNFEILFPQTATPTDKLMMIGNVLMLDYIIFENPGELEQQNQF